MKTLLVIGRNLEFVEQVRNALDPEHYQVVAHADLGEAEALLLHGLVTACIFDLEELPQQTLARIDTLHRLLPECPIIAYAGGLDMELETRAYLEGATYVLHKPVHAGSLNAILSRIGARAPGLPPPVPVGLPLPVAEAPQARAIPPPAETRQALAALKDFTHVLAASLSRTELLKRFLIILREITGINRAAFFLRQPVLQSPRAAKALEFKFKLACGFGLPGLGHDVELSLASGICKYLYRSGQILRVDSPELAYDPEARKEFEVFGVQAAIPIFEHDSLSGVVLLGGRLTGTPLSPDELEAIFFAVEQLAHAIRHTWQHEQLAANHKILADLVRELHLACIVVSPDQRIIQFNRAARKLLSKELAKATHIVLSDLPEPITTCILEVIKTGKTVGPFKYEPPAMPGLVFQITILPLPGQNADNAALLIGEDLSQAEKLKKLEIETANLRLMREMAERSVHDIGNALVPLVTHHEMLRTKARDPHFLASLDNALTESVRRITRRLEQLRYLAKDELGELQRFSLGELLEAAFADAKLHAGVETAQLITEDYRKLVLVGDAASLKRAFSELFLNAIQANPAQPHVQLRIESRPLDHSRPGYQIEIEDTGPGFTPEEVAKAGTAFWSRRAVGMGLGLAVARKIIAMHRGRFQVRPAWEGHGGLVIVWLPAGNGQRTRNQQQPGHVPASPPPTQPPQPEQA